MHRHVGVLAGNTVISPCCAPPRDRWADQRAGEVGPLHGHPGASVPRRELGNLSSAARVGGSCRPARAASSPPPSAMAVTIEAGRNTGVARPEARSSKTVSGPCSARRGRRRTLARHWRRPRVEARSAAPYGHRSCSTRTTTSSSIDPPARRARQRGQQSLDPALPPARTSTFTEPDLAHLPGQPRPPPPGRRPAYGGRARCGDLDRCIACSRLRTGRCEPSAHENRQPLKDDTAATVVCTPAAKQADNGRLGFGPWCPRVQAPRT
jgi:hypothetical protein